MVKALVILAIGSLAGLLAAPVRDRQEAAVKFPVFLNHFYLTLDHMTYSAIKGSEFVCRKVAVTEERTTVRKDRTYTGLYFYGTNTYFEFFDADKETGRRVGDSAIAFGVEEAGASEKLQGPLGSHAVTITRLLDNIDVPWFFQTMPKGFSLASGMSTWVMEYHPRFLPEWHAEAGGGSGITRREILQRYKMVLKRGSEQTSFSDVMGITLAADKQVTRQMTELCKIFGYRSRIEGDSTVLQGPDFELRLMPETESARGIRQVSIRANGMPMQQMNLQFGSKSVLSFHTDGTATWSF